MRQRQWNTGIERLNVHNRQTKIKNLKYNKLYIYNTLVKIRAKQLP